MVKHAKPYESEYGEPVGQQRRRGPGGWPKYQTPAQSDGQWWSRPRSPRHPHVRSAAESPSRVVHAASQADTASLYTRQNACDPLLLIRPLSTELLVSSSDHSNAELVIHMSLCPDKPILAGFSRSFAPYPFNWLRVLDTAERSQIDQGICHQLHPIVSLLDAFKTKQQPLELVFPRKGALDTHP